MKAVEDDPNLPKKKAARALTKFLVMHPTNITQKIEVIVEHFRSHVRTHLGGRAKAGPHGSDLASVTAPHCMYCVWKLTVSARCALPTKANASRSVRRSNSDSSLGAMKLSGASPAATCMPWCCSRV